MRRETIAIACLMASSVSALAQTVPAEMGITPSTTPEVLQTLDKTKTWVPLGTVNSSTHTFTPVGGGSGYATHALLTAGVTTPSGGNAVGQQGFYAPGDGGAATYQWSLTSYCAGGTSGAPATADGIACVLPTSQSASTAGRYLLQMGNGIDVRQIGMVGDGVTDNSPLVATLMGLISPANSQASGFDVLFPAIPRQTHTDYYFSKSFHATRHVNITCQGLTTAGDSTTRLIFAPGVHGVVFDNYGTSPDGTGMGGGGMTGCGVESPSYYYGAMTASSATITGVALAGWVTTYPWGWASGDGIIAYSGYQPVNGAPAVPAGTRVVTANSSTTTLTLSSPVNVTSTGVIWRLSAASAFTVNTTSGSATVTVTAGPSLLAPGDYVWSDAFPFGTVVRAASGPLGAQTLTMDQWDLLGGSQAASQSETGGKMWIIPAAVKMFVPTHLFKNTFQSIPIGLEMECSDYGSVPTNCTASKAQENDFGYSMIGRLAIGDNTGASSSIANMYYNNSFTDIIEGGTIGSVYLGDNSNSAESGQSLYAVIGECGRNNQSIFIGMYIGMPQPEDYCLSSWGTAVSGSSQATTFIGVMGIDAGRSAPVGAPTLQGNVFSNEWLFAHGGGVHVCFNTPAGGAFAFSSGNQFCDGPLTWSLNYSGSGFWALNYFNGSGGNTMWLTEGTNGGYTGYTAGTAALVMFKQGFLLSDIETGGYGVTGPERLVDSGLGVPAATFHKQGDIHFNQAAAVGSPAGWVNTADGANFKPFGTISTFNGTKTAGSCVFTIVNGVITNVTGC